METVAQKYLQQLCGRMKAMGTALTLPRDLPGFLCGKCRGKDGARQLRRLVQREVEGPLAAYLLQSGRKPAEVFASVREGRVCFQPEFNRTDV